MMPDGTLMRSFARSGATWTNTITTHLDTAAYSERLDDNNVMYNQAMRLIGAVKRGDLPSPDVIILSAGTNDAWFKARRPGIFDIKELTDSMSYTTLPSERTTLVGSLRLVLNLLNHELPGAAMVLITPPYTDRASKEDINIVSKYISEIGCSIGIPLVALNTLSGIDPGREHRKPYLTTDGTHTSPEGAKIIASIIYNALMINKLITE